MVPKKQIFATIDADNFESNSWLVFNKVFQAWFKKNKKRNLFFKINNFHIHFSIYRKNMCTTTVHAQVLVAMRTILRQQYAPIRGILSVAEGMFLESRSNMTKNEVNMFMPRSIFAGDSGGRKNSIMVREERRMQGRTSMYLQKPPLRFILMLYVLKQMNIRCSLLKTYTVLFSQFFNDGAEKTFHFYPYPSLLRGYIH